jgi:hypothetical protein
VGADGAAVLCEPLLRVLTGWLWAAGDGDAAALCEPLLRVATGTADACDWPVPPACAPLARVAAALGRARPATTRAPEPREPRRRAPGSWRITWIVRRITCVRTSTAGLRAARIAVLLLGAGLKASAARPPAVTAMTTAATRE